MHLIYIQPISLLDYKPAGNLLENSCIALKGDYTLIIRNHRLLFTLWTIGGCGN